MFHAEKSRRALISHLTEEERAYRSMISIGRMDSAALALGGPIMTLGADSFLFPQYDDAVRKFKEYSREWLQEMA